MVTVKADQQGEVTFQADADWYELRVHELGVKRQPTWDEFAAWVPPIAQLRKSMPFFIGDFLVLGYDTFGEEASQVEDIFGEYDYNTLANYKSTCLHVPADIRVEDLDYSHHALVKSTKIDKSDKVTLLRYMRKHPTLKRKLAVKEARRMVNKFVAGEDPKNLSEIDLTGGAGSSGDQSTEDEMFIDRVKEARAKIDKALEMTEFSSEREHLVRADDQLEQVIKLRRKLIESQKEPE